MNQRLYYNGVVLTAIDEAFCAQAVLTENGRIKEVFFNNADSIELRFPNAEKVDLKGNILIPGFVDGHSHFLQTVFERQYLNAKSSPLGESDSVEALLESLKKQLKEPRFAKQEYLFANGYDEAVYPDHRLPTRYDLDSVTNKPLALSHISGHNTVFNSAALAAAGIDDGYTPPPDGSVGRFPDGTLSGVFYENAKQDVFPQLNLNVEDILRNGIKEAALNYASVGVTTAQDGATGLEWYKITRQLALEGELPIDLVSYLFGEDTGKILDDDNNKRYNGHYRAAGYKIFLDGSPQAKTAWLSKPYRKTLIGHDENYRGSGIYTDEQLKKIVSNAVKKHWQLNVHTNGDEAIEQFLNVYEEVKKEFPYAAETRPVCIHCQTVRADQLDRMKELGILASFFVDHVYYWGDYHEQEILGEERARRISPLAQALKKGVRFSLHQDTPVTLQSPLFAIHNAVNRVTRSGRILGEEFRISPQQALKAVTIDSAYQIFEDKNKGSIEPGKYADFVVLDQNILTVSPEQIKNIKVLETIKDDKTVFKLGEGTYESD